MNWKKFKKQITAKKEGEIGFLGFDTCSYKLLKPLRGLKVCMFEKRVLMFFPAQQCSVFFLGGLG